MTNIIESLRSFAMYNSAIPKAKQNPFKKVTELTIMKVPIKYWLTKEKHCGGLCSLIWY